jgi:hypothetical protein
MSRKRAAEKEPENDASDRDEDDSNKTGDNGRLETDVKRLKVNTIDYFF